MINGGSSILLCSLQYIGLLSQSRRDSFYFFVRAFCTTFYVLGTFCDFWQMEISRKCIYKDIQRRKGGARQYFAPPRENFFCSCTFSDGFYVYIVRRVVKQVRIRVFSCIRTRRYATGLRATRRSNSCELWVYGTEVHVLKKKERERKKNKSWRGFDCQK